MGLLLLCPIAAWGAVASGGGEPVAQSRREVADAGPLVKVAEYRMREPRFGAAAVVRGDHIYITGGSNAESMVLDSIERFDCRTGESEDFARLQIGRLWHCAALVGETIHVMGGETTAASGPAANRLAPDDSVEIVDLQTRRVSRGPALPEPRRSFGCVPWGGRLHLIGGCLRSGEKTIRSNTVQVFEPSTRQWSPAAPMPTAREAEAILVDGPLMVVPGGYDGAQARDVVEAFDPRAGVWKRLPPLCRVASAHALAGLGPWLFLFGHYDAIEQCLAYDLRSGRSEPIAPSFKGARHSAAVVHEGRIYVIGGRTEEFNEVLDLVQVFALRGGG